jgi:hypothetical protein
MFKMGGWRPGAGRKPKLSANIRFGIASEVCAEIDVMRRTERARQYADDPSRTLIADQRRRIQHHADRHYDRRAALHYIEANSRAIDQLGRLWSAAHRSYKADAIKAVAARHNLPARVVRDCYRELGRHVPEPEPTYTFFDLWPRPVVTKLVESLYRISLFRWMLRDTDDEILAAHGASDPDFANKATRDEFANRSVKRAEGLKPPSK